MSYIINSPSTILRYSVPQYNLFTLEISCCISTVVTSPFPPIPAYNLNVIQFKSLSIILAKDLDITPSPSNADNLVCISVSSNYILSSVYAVSFIIVTLYFYTNLYSKAPVACSFSHCSN